MGKKILQISPFPFEHLGGVEKYAEILEEIFAKNYSHSELDKENSAFKSGKFASNFSDSHLNFSESSALSYENGFSSKNKENSGLNPEGQIIFSTIEAGKNFRIFEPVANCSVPNFFDKNFWKIFREISNKNTKILISHIRFSPVTWFVFCFAKAKKIPYIHIEHGTGFLVHSNFFIKNIAKIVDLTIGKYILKNADFVVTISKASENWVKNFAGRTKNIETIYRGFEMKNFIKKSNPLPIIGFVGRFNPYKNVNILIEAIKKIDKKCKLQIVGDGEMRQEWEKLAKNHKNIEFLGPKKHNWILKNFLPNIDIFVNPSLQEGLPTTIVEAILSGCEPIATNVGGTSEIPNIHIIEANQKELEKKLCKILENFEPNKEKKVEFSSEFLDKFSLEKMQENYENIFKKF